MTDISAIRPGQVILVSDGRQAIVRFAGTTSFALGEWVGIELEDASGKNDGSVKGERYFDCEMGHGMFIRPSAVSEIIEQPRLEPKTNGRPTNGTAVRTRPSSGVPNGVGAAATKRQSILGSSSTAKRMSMNAASPTPGARGVAAGARNLRSPTKSPTKQMAPTSSSGTTARSTPSNATRPSLGGTKSKVTTSSRTSMGPPANPASRTSRPSFAPSRPSIGPLSRPTSTSSNGHLSRPASKPVISASRPIADRGSDNGDTHTPTEEHEEDGEVLKMPLGSVEINSQTGMQQALPQSSDAPSSRKAQKPEPRATMPQKSFGQSASHHKEVEDLKAKLRLVEKKRVEDREKLKSLEKVQAERDKFEGIIQKLQTKYQPQQQELTDLRRQLKEAETKVDDIERQQAENESVLEMATLDREMAEETAEAYRNELDALKTRAEELELEVEVLRDENQELGQVMSPEEKSSHGWLQMEKTNERLREALLRLRDLTQQSESDLKAQIKELEDDLEELNGVKREYDVVSHKFAQSEETVEDLRQQLEAALGAEDMIEELTERNMQYQEQVENLKVAIEDLESLKELNDELEINHVEAENQLQEEIDYRESLYNEQSRKVAQQDEMIVDLEYTLSRFRELVANLQSDLEDMRASQQITETEATELSSRSKAMMDLNLKLQASASRTQVKTVDMELRRLDAQEAADHLSMVQLFLPESFDSEKDPILTFLRFKRISFKGHLLQGMIRERTGDAGSSQDDVYAAYDIIEKLTWISSICGRFVSVMSECEVDAFLKLEGALYELEPVERGLNGWIEGLKKNEINEKQCGVELQRSIALLSHLTETSMPTGLQSYAEETQMRALLIQTYLESTAASLNHMKTDVGSRIQFPEQEESLYFLQRFDSLATQARSSKVIVGKVLRSLEELKSSSLSLSDDAAQPFEDSEYAAKELSACTRRLGEDVADLLAEEGRTDPFTQNEIVRSMAKSTARFFSSSNDDADPMATLNAKLKSIASRLETLISLSSDLAKTQEFERQPAPWLLRARALKSSKTLSPDTEEEIRRLKAELKERSTTLGIRDQTLEENSIKIQLLESRINEAQKKTTLIAELETRLAEARKREVDFAESIENHRKDIQLLEQERDNYKHRMNERPMSIATEDATSLQIPANHASVVNATKTIESLRYEISGLEASIRFLHDENRRLKLTDPASTDTNRNTWLNEPLLARKTTEQEKRRQATKVECHDVLNSLLKMTEDAKFIRLKSPDTGEDGKVSIWKPMKETSMWQAARMREQWEDWKDWRDEVVRRETGWKGRIGMSATGHKGTLRKGKVDGPVRVVEC